MNKRYLLIGVIALGLLLVAAFIMWRFRRRRPKPDYFQRQWRELQKLCASKDTWPLAVVNADKLFDEALKKCHCKGKSMGERMVSAQRQISDNDAVWYAHNLAKKILEDTPHRLREAEVKRSLIGFRQALRDLGALRGKS